MAKPLPKGSMIGILGGGQLGMMTIKAAHDLGYKCHVFAPDGDAPACGIADEVTRADYTDTESVKRFAREIDTVTSEFENVPCEVMETIADTAPNLAAISPGVDALRVAQHRIKEKTLARDLGMMVPEFAHIKAASDIVAPFGKMKSGGILKTCSLGYDGKGQAAIDSPDDIESAFASLKSDDCILEEKIAFKAEASFLVARAADGTVKHFPASINSHKNGILSTSEAPADSGILPETLLHAGQEFIEKMAANLNLTGLLAMEVFITDSGLVFNEIAPRPHNSFHWTIEGTATSQFAQLVRAITNMPLGATDATGRWRMENILGDDADMEKLAAAKGDKNIFTHDYGKREARPGRKMAHLTYRLPD